MIKTGDTFKFISTKSGYVGRYILGRIYKIVRVDHSTIEIMTDNGSTQSWVSECFTGKIPGYWEKAKQKTKNLPEWW